MLMRIPARWTWIPLAITVAGIVYISMVKIANYQAALRLPQVVRDKPLPFVPPPAPAKREPQPMPAEPNVDVKPLRPLPPALPELQLPPFHAKPKK